ncbi:hypothetical protein SAMN05519103_07961 [Rhizobiales bacterium GAS113]|nr:hypothetical protein SAMN05519103_07961 [Rhizobiales bacterium GAS113]
MLANRSQPTRKVPVAAEAPGPSLPPRRFRWMDHFWKMALIASFLLVSNRIVLAAIGALNGRLSFIKTVFLVYPGSEDVVSKYCYAALQDWACWRPTLIGAYHQNGSWGLMFGIAGTEDAFDRHESADHLKGLQARMEAIRTTLRARELRLAGVLPSRLSAEGAPISELEAGAAVAALAKAELMVRSVEQIDETAPVIVLGANGFVGQRLATRLAHRNIHRVDIGPLGATFPNRDAWPAQLTGRRALLINVARTQTLAAYVDLLWSSLVVLNEAYPAPDQHVLQKLSALNCSCYHLAGAVGDAYPDFPWPYAGAIPCCAAQVDDGTALVVRRLV